MKKNFFNAISAVTMLAVCILALTACVDNSVKDFSTEMSTYEKLEPQTISDEKTNQGNLTEEIVDLSIPPAEEYVISCLEKLDSIDEIVAVTELNDPNRALNKESSYISQVFFPAPTWIKTKYMEKT